MSVCSHTSTSNGGSSGAWATPGAWVQLWDGREGANSWTTLRLMVQVGDSLPEVTLFEGDLDTKVVLTDLFKGKKVRSGCE